MTTPPPTPEQHAEATQNAWQIHQQIADWTGKTDTKASFILGLQTALFGAAVYLRTDNHILSSPRTDFALGSLVVCFFLLTFGMILTMVVVAPSLAWKQARSNWPSNYIYFGHLEKWKGDEAGLQAKLETADILPVLTLQLTTMSEIAWLKHRRLQLSVLLTFVGAAGLGLAILFA